MEVFKVNLVLFGKLIFMICIMPIFMICTMPIYLPFKLIFYPDYGDPGDPGSL